MKITVLVDNNSIIDKYYLAEPAFSLYIEDDESKILFDTGYSDIFLDNANKMNIDLNQIDTLVLSHGHNDHTGGLVYLNDLKQKIRVIAHNNVDKHKEYEGLNISSPIQLADLPNNFQILKTKEPIKISKHLTFLGQIPRTIQPQRNLENDTLEDDSALVYECEKGIFIITGCSHSGICNIVEYAKKLTNKNHILGILGGFHILNNTTIEKEVCKYFASQDIDVIYPCHCTDLHAKIELSKVCNIKEVGVSLQIDI